MALDDLAANGQSDAGSLVFLAAMQPLEQSEYLLGVFFIEADAIVRDLYGAQSILRLGARHPPVARFEHSAHDADDGSLARALELQRVAYEILEKLPHLRRVRRHDRKRADLHPRPRLLDAHLQIDHYLTHDPFQIGWLKWLRPARDSRQGQQILDERLHPAGSAVHPAQIIEPRLAQLRRALFAQPVPKRLNLPQWLLKIMRSHRGKALQFRVAALELLREQLRLLLRLLALADVCADTYKTRNSPSGIADGHLGRHQPGEPPGSVACRLLAIDDWLPGRKHCDVIAVISARKIVGKEIENRAPLDIMQPAGSDEIAMRGVVDHVTAVHVLDVNMIADRIDDRAQKIALIGELSFRPPPQCDIAQDYKHRHGGDQSGQQRAERDHEAGRPSKRPHELRSAPEQFPLLLLETCCQRADLLHHGCAFIIKKRSGRCLSPGAPPHRNHLVHQCHPTLDQRLQSVEPLDLLRAASRQPAKQMHGFPYAPARLGVSSQIRFAAGE